MFWHASVHPSMILSVHRGGGGVRSSCWGGGGWVRSSCWGGGQVQPGGGWVRSSCQGGWVRSSCWGGGSGPAGGVGQVQLLGGWVRSSQGGGSGPARGVRSSCPGGGGSGPAAGEGWVRSSCRGGSDPAGGGWVRSSRGGSGPAGGGGGGSAKIEQHREYLLHGGRYASCVHAGGLSCFFILCCKLFSCTLLQSNVILAILLQSVVSCDNLHLQCLRQHDTCSIHMCLTLAQYWCFQTGVSRCTLISWGPYFIS